MWVTLDLNYASGCAQNRDGSSGLIVEFALSFSPRQMVDWDNDLSGDKGHLNKLRIENYKNGLFCIIDAISQSIGGYTRIPGVAPIRLLDQNGNQVA